MPHLSPAFVHRVEPGVLAHQGPGMSLASKSLAGMGTGMGTGMGEVEWYEYIPLAPSNRESDPCAASPPWCDYTPFSDFITECQPVDPARCQVRTFGPALSPESRAKAIEDGNAVTVAYLAQNPDMASAYQGWLDDKWFYTLDPTEYGERAKWTGYAFIGFAVLATLMVARGARS